MIIQQTSQLFAHRLEGHKVAVIVPLHNYERYIVETLDSVAAQTLRDTALIVVDDCSTDRSAEVVSAWMAANRNCGLGLGLWRNERNARLAVTRNTGIALSSAQYCFFLDADNALYPRCLEKHAQALDDRPDAAAAYSLIEVFGRRGGVLGTGVFERAALSCGNYIDAMAMVRRSALVELGGFVHIDHGWEDYDLWLRLCEAGGMALHIPEILSRYREHGGSMLRTQTNLPDHIRQLHAELNRRHPWLDLH